MPYTVVQLGPVTFSSGATIIGMNGKVDDAETIALFANTATTTPVHIEVEMTDTGASWQSLTLPISMTSSGLLASPIWVTSSGTTILTDIAYTRMRFTSSGVVNSGTSITAAKQILV